MAKQKSQSSDQSLVWIDAGNGYSLALRDKKLVCRNAKGQLLSSVPPAVKDGDVADQLREAVEWLSNHERECRETVEAWMLRSLVIPRGILQAVWSDGAWRAPLENTVVMPVDLDGRVSPDQAGLFRGVDESKGIGVVNLDGETLWIDTPLVVIPHPILLPELNDFRDLLTDLDIKQGISQVFREIWPKSATLSAATTNLNTYSDGHFEQLNHALGRCRKLGYRVRGGWACGPVWEGGKLVEARYWIGADYPESETYTGELIWVDAKERTLKLADVGPVAFSEGNRMASLIYAARKVEKKEGEASTEETAETETPTAAPVPVNIAVGSSISVSTTDTLRAGGLVLVESQISDKEPVDRVSARTYCHPAMPEETVVRLSADVLSRGDDRVMEVLGFDPPDIKPELALQRRRAIGFPGWALIHDPDRASFALDVVKEMKKHGRLAKSKPGHAKDGFDQIGERLGRSVPHYLPSYYEEVGRIYIELGNQTYAAQAFNKAREAERVHALKIDEEQRQASFLDFALAGALTVKALSQYAKDLLGGFTPEIAYKTFRDLVVKRTLGGLPPWGSVGKDIRPLMTAAGLNVEAEERVLLEEFLDSPVMAKAPVEFWTAYRKPLLVLAKASPKIRGILLNLFPKGNDEMKFHQQWLELLGECGALEAVIVPAETVPEECRPVGGAAAWFSRELSHTFSGYRSRLPFELFGLLRRMAPRLIAEGQPITLDTTKYYQADIDLDLLEQALELGVPINDPQPKSSIDLAKWLHPPDKSEEWRRDPVHTAAEPRFRPLLIKGVGGVISNSEFHQAAHGKKGLTEARRLWYETQATELETAFLEDFSHEVSVLEDAITPEVLEEFPEIAGRLTAIDPAVILSRTLQAGVLDEYGWPDLEAAVEELTAGVKDPVVRLVGAFPYLIVSDTHKAIVVGPKGRVKTLQLNLPAKAYLMTCRYVDGELIVAYRDSSYHTKAFWTSNPMEQIDLGYMGNYQIGTLALPVPGGGTTEGQATLRVGDTKIDFGYGSITDKVLSDGQHFWRIEHKDGKPFREFDPATGEGGRWSLPKFYEEFSTGDKPIFAYLSHFLAPLPEGLEQTPLGTKDGLTGFRGRCPKIENIRQSEVAAQGYELEGIDGRRFEGNLRSVTDYFPQGLVQFPGDDLFRPVLATYNMISLWDPTGKHKLVSIEFSKFNPEEARGTTAVFPLVWWHFLKVRDQAGSEALRRISAEACRQLLQTARAECPKPDDDDDDDVDVDLSKLPKTLETLQQVLPEVTHPRLQRGILGIVAQAAQISQQYSKVLGESDSEEQSPNLSASLPTFSNLVAGALLPLVETGWGRWSSEEQNLGRQFVETDQFFREELDPAVTLERKAAHARVQWETLIGRISAIALKAAVFEMDADLREKLLEFLEFWSKSVFAAPDTKIRFIAGQKGTPDTVGAYRYDDPREGERLVTHAGNRYLLKTVRNYNSQRFNFSGIEYAASGEFQLLPETTIERSQELDSGRLSSENLQTLIAAVKKRGPVAWNPAIAEDLANRTGLSKAAAALLWLGCPKFEDYSDNFLPKDLRTRLGLKVAEAVAARREIKDTLPQNQWLDLYAEAFPDNAEHLWQPLGTGPTDEESPVARLARAWVKRVGRKVAVPVELMAQATAAFEHLPVKPALILEAIVNPSQSGLLTKDTEFYFNEAAYLTSKIVAQAQPADVDPDEMEEEDLQPKQNQYFQFGVATTLVNYVPFLYDALPVGDPFRASLPEVLDLVIKRLQNPELLVALGDKHINVREQNLEKVQSGVDAFLNAIGGDTYTTPDVPAEKMPKGRDNGALVAIIRHLSDYYASISIAYRPSKVTDFAQLQKLIESPDFYAQERQPVTELLFSAGYRAIIERIKSTPVPVGQWECNPKYSVPELVQDVQQTLNLSENAAILYLQTLALAEPTTKNIQKWNGWTAAQYKKAADELVKASLVLEARRERAGRAHFLPGGWTALKAPHLPIETWKLAMFGVERVKVPQGVQTVVKLKKLFPLRPYHQLFAEVWERIKQGDKPDYEEVE